MFLKFRQKTATLFLAFLLLLVSIFTAFIGCSVAPSVSPIATAKADEATGYPLSDNIFSFSNGASLSQGFMWALGFGLNLNDPAFETFSENDERTYYFTMYRVSGDGATSVPVVQYMFFRSGGALLAMHKNLSYYTNENFYFSPAQKRGNLYPENDKNYVFFKELFAEQQYVLDYISQVDVKEPDFNMITEETSKLLRFAVDVNDCYTSYFVRFNYTIKKYVKTEKYGFLWLKERKVFDTYSGTIDSPQRSVYQVLENMNKAGMLETEFEDYPAMLAKATEILENKAVKRIQVKYLTRIGNTPFATHNYAYVEVPVISTTIPVDRVAAALNVKDFDALGCSCYGFEYDTATDIYVGKYLKNVWLSAKTVDGNSANYFLDCNLSYKDYYYQFVTDGIFSNDLYQYIFNQMLNKYAELKGYKFDTVYGYFGYVVIPNTYSLNALWVEMFDTKTTFKGGVKTYQYTELLSHSSYQKLLSDYDYTWLEKAWSTVAGFVTGGSWSADHYLFYADIDQTEILIAENGADDMLDDSGLIHNKVEDGIVAVKDGVKNAWGGIKDFFKDKQSRFNVIFGIIAVSLLAVLVVWAFVSIRDMFIGNKK